MSNIIKLPSEGLTLEALWRPIGGMLFQPVVSSILLLASLREPQRIKKLLSRASKNTIELSVVNRALKILIAIGVLYRLNSFLSRRALNNFTRDRSWDWRKEIVVVTGGCSGIGELMVRKFAKSSIKVVALDLNPPKTPFPANTFFHKTDVTSPFAIRETAQQIRQEVGEPTVLINNAGIGHVKPMLNETEEQIKRTFDVNIMAHFWLIREFLPYMVQQNHGHIVTIASLASFMAHASNMDYACTKAAALAFHEGLAQELKHVYGAKKVRTT